MPAEVGSEFHWNPAVLGGAGPPLPAGHVLFATGCGAMVALLRRLAPRGRLHMPSYFCMGVAEALSADVPLAWYRHLPGEQGPRLSTLRAGPGDVVLAHNLFGREAREPWDTWQRDHPGVVVIEDHSHDPFSDWARHSSASYAVASLRKTLPLPDGGLLWSPRGLDLPEPAGDESSGAGLKLAAMLLKAAWLDGRAVEKHTFRTLQQRGEVRLLGSTGPASAVTRAVLPLLDVAALRAADVRTARALAAALPAETPQWQVVGAGPFRVQLGCRSEEVRDELLAYLAQHGIYAPVHWRQDRGGLWSGDLAAADLASRMLTVPVDHRCGADDITRVGDALLAFAGQPIGE